MKIYSYQLITSASLVRMTAHMDLASARLACKEFLIGEVSILIRRDKLLLPELKELEEHVKADNLEAAIEKYNNYKLHFGSRVIVHGIFEFEMLDLLPKDGGVVEGEIPEEEVFEEGAPPPNVDAAAPLNIPEARVAPRNPVAINNYIRIMDPPF